MSVYATAALDPREVAEPHHGAKITTPPDINTERILLHRAEQTYEAGICLCSFPSGNSEEVLSLLSMEERQCLARFAFEKRALSYSVGRYAAKKALMMISNELPSNIHIENGIFNHPVVRNSGKDKYGVSISHTSELVAAVAFPDTHPLGIDIEKIDHTKVKIIEKELTVKEHIILEKHSSDIEYGELVISAWTIKEALSKILKTGLTTSLDVYEIIDFVKKRNHTVNSFKNFNQYKAITYNINNHICSLVVPKKSELQWKFVEGLFK